ncbi:hypothetical protein [Nitratireductor soli]|uniref:hypothetical protein n=1 Tax=Nitratireductor soli TaxID=1670619 RepID=UPI00065E2A1B|nr:hypothetical protein [Nitratireductor soli]
MPRQTKRNRSAALALALLASAFLCQTASADPLGGGDANIKSMSFSATSGSTTLHVISTDGQKWDKLKAGNLVIDADMDLDTRWPGYTYETGIVLGACGGPLCQSFPAIFFDQPGSRDYHKQTNVAFASSKIPVSTTGIAILPDGDQMIARCNEHLQPDGPTKSFSFNHEMWATFVANTGSYIHNTDNILYEASAGDGIAHPESIDHARKDSFNIQVVCDPVIKPPTDDLSLDQGDFNVENVKLFLTTVIQINPTGGNPGTVCPVLRVTARAETNQEGPVTMRIWEQLNGGPITSKVKQAWASYDAAKNGYFASYEEYKNFGATTHAQYRVEIVDNTTPFPPFDGWKTITVHCTGAGGGGLTTTPPVNPDLPQPQASWEGEIIVADSAGADKSCPRKGQAFFAVTRQVPGDFTYRISCSNGAFFTGTATAYNQGSGIFEAYGAHDLSITKTRSIQCTLQELKPNGTPVTIDTDKTDFTCANRAIDPGSNDITITPRPQPQEPKEPSVVVIPQPKCSNGLVLRNGRCFKRPVTVRPRPVRPTLPPVVVTPRPQPECLGGMVLRNGKCVRRPVIAERCDRGEILLRGKCVRKPVVSILCKPGYKLVRDKCVKTPVIVQRCKRGEVLVRGQCIQKPGVSILCKPGYKLVRDKCVKQPAVTTRQPTRAKTFIAPKPQVEKRRVLRGQTVRPLRQRLDRR